MLESHNPRWIDEPPHPPNYDDSLEMEPALRALHGFSTLRSLGTLLFPVIARAEAGAGPAFCD